MQTKCFQLKCYIHHQSLFINQLMDRLNLPMNKTMSKKPTLFVDDACMADTDMFLEEAFPSMCERREGCLFQDGAYHLLFCVKYMHLHVF